MGEGVGTASSESRESDSGVEALDGLGVELLLDDLKVKLLGDSEAELLGGSKEALLGGFEVEVVAVGAEAGADGGDIVSGDD